MSRLLARIVLCFTFLVATAPTYAASITFDAPFCSGFSVSGTGPNYTLTCESMACTAAVSANSALPGQPIVIAMSCPGGATIASYQWAVSGTSGCVTPSQGSYNVITGPVEASCTYRIIATANNGDKGSAVANVAWTATPLAAPSCSAPSLVTSPSPMSSAGGSASLNVSCTGTGITYAWRRTAPSAGTLSSSSSASDSLAANATSGGITYTYAVDACTGPTAASCTSQTISVVVPSATGGGGGGGGAGGGTGLCAGLPNVVMMDVPWGGTITTRGSGSTFQSNGMVVAKFTVPAGYSTTPGFKGKIQAAEYGDPAVYRQTSLSTQACDFRGAATKTTDTYITDPTGTNNPLKFGFGNTAIVEFTVTGTALFTPQLVPGQTYYYNIRNWSPYANGGSGGTSCTNASGHCDIIVSHNTP
jgi:hypothetical protein